MADRKQTFTPEFRAEAVRLAQTSGRSRREVAADLGVGLSTLRNWIDGRREREMDYPPADRQEDMVAEFKRLRRENEVLRQEREILKRATAFFAKEGTSHRSSPCGHPPHVGAGSKSARELLTQTTSTISRSGRRWIVQRTFSWLSHWGSLRGEYAGCIDVTTERLTCVASLLAANALENPT
jgi:transposase